MEWTELVSGEMNQEDVSMKEDDWSDLHVFSYLYLKRKLNSAFYMEGQ